MKTKILNIVLKLLKSTEKLKGTLPKVELSETRKHTTYPHLRAMDNVTNITVEPLVQSKFMKPLRMHYSQNGYIINFFSSDSEFVLISRFI